jgi:hypothetical protein
VTEVVDVPSMQGIGEVIRLAVAPVFLISGVGTMLALFSNRLARAVDRSLDFQRLVASTTDAKRLEDLQTRLAALARRARLLSSAITLAAICGLFVSMVVVLLFMGEALEFRVGYVIGLLFIAAMVSFIASILCFLREVYIATRSLRRGLYRHH